MVNLSDNGIIWYHHCHWWNGSCSTIKMLLNCVSNIWQLKRITFQENVWKDYFGINSFFTASSASVRTSLFTTVEAAAQEMMETNAARTRRRCDNMISLQLSPVFTSHFIWRLRSGLFEGTGGCWWWGLMVRHFPTSPNDPAPPNLSEDILEIPTAEIWISTL